MSAGKGWCPPESMPCPVEKRCCPNGLADVLVPSHSTAGGLAHSRASVRPTRLVYNGGMKKVPLRLKAALEWCRRREFERAGREGFVDERAGWKSRLECLAKYRVKGLGR